MSDTAIFIIWPIPVEASVVGVDHELSLHSIQHHILSGISEGSSGIISGWSLLAVSSLVNKAHESSNCVSPLEGMLAGLLFPEQ